MTFFACFENLRANDRALHGFFFHVFWPCLAVRSSCFLTFLLTALFGSLLVSFMRRAQACFACVFGDFFAASAGAVTAIATARLSRSARLIVYTSFRRRSGLRLNLLRGQ